MVVISAASGTGKTTIIDHITKSNDNIVQSISHTTRQKRLGEKDGIDYFFITKDKFDKMVQNNEFLEHAKVFDNYYGTSKFVIDDNINNGKTVILDIDWQGMREMKKIYKEKMTSIFILPPSILELEKRLRSRNTDKTETIKSRMAAAKDEISHANEFDYNIVNDRLDIAIKEVLKIICKDN